MAKDVKLTGAFFEKQTVNKISIAREGALQRIGTEVAGLMRDETEPYDWQGTLTKSIAWRTVMRYSRVPNESHLIDAPDSLDSVDIGSKAPHAWYREYGAGPHMFPQGSSEFIASMKAWVADKIGINPDGSEEERGIFWAIVNSIRYGDKAVANEQNKQPFLAPILPAVPGITQRVAQDAFQKMWEALAGEGTK